MPNAVSGQGPPRVQGPGLWDQHEEVMPSRFTGTFPTRLYGVSVQAAGRHRTGGGKWTCWKQVQA